jgi:hypothetical protein
MKRLLFCFVLFATQSLCAVSFTKVVIWGHKLHSHTHSYIHHAFYRAFCALGYQTYWMDDKDNLATFDFAHTLFVTEGQADHAIPLRDDCFYILHNCTSAKYADLKSKKRCLTIQVYSDDCLERPHLKKMAPCIYIDIAGRCLYMPWATDLLPDEIEQEKQKIGRALLKRKPTVHWIGTIGSGLYGNTGEISPFKRACRERGVSFKHHAQVSMQKNISYIQQSYMAPAIVGKWQVEHGYIPCRIFKNISYGQMGITNSYRVYELFEGKIVYNPDTYKLFYDAEKRLKTLSRKELFDLMDFVKTKHTYINRIQTILKCLGDI